MRDPYTVLGVSRKADEAQIKRAFRGLAKKHHPDQNAEDPKAKEKFAEINTAYEILGDKAKRARFDRGELGPDGKERGGFSQGAGGFRGFGTDPFQYRTSTSGGASGGGSSGGGAAFEDILKDIFGKAPGGGAGAHPGAGQRARPANGDDVVATLTLTLEDLVSDSKPTVSLPNGKTLQITIPGGAEDGQQVRLKGQGNPGRDGGRPGDAIITLKLAAHTLFRRDGTDLRLDLPISLDEAVLGAKIRVPTLEGAVGLTIAPNTTGRRSLRIRGKGLPDKKGNRGDIFVTPRIILPEEADKTLEKLAHGMKRDASKTVRGPEFEV